MCQSLPVYHESPSLALLEPWMLARLPKVVEETARAHIIHLAAGIFESHSALVANIASSSAFQANTESSNETQVRRILRDERAFLTLALPNYAVFFQEETEYRVPADAERDLDAVAALLKGKPASRVRLIGYGDAIGSRAANLKIALARARKVATDLIARGVDQSRLVLAARDDTQEIAQGKGPGNPNRRVTFEPAYIGE